MATPQAWSAAYARQASADLGTYETLQDGEYQKVPVCHRLQFLQMACEKLVKAHLCGSGTDPLVMQSSHAYIAKTLPIVLGTLPEFLSLKPANAREIKFRARQLAQEIEVLAPAVKRGGDRPDNCEYPWEDAGGQLHLPLEWSFTPSTLVAKPSGRTILKLIHVAIGRMVR